MSFREFLDLKKLFILWYCPFNTESLTNKKFDGLQM